MASLCGHTGLASGAGPLIFKRSTDRRSPMAKCAICSKPSTADYRPFCSRRCADVDLARWLNGSYAVPSDDPDDQERALEEAAKSNPRLH